MSTMAQRNSLHSLRGTSVLLALLLLVHGNFCFTAAHSAAFDAKKKLKFLGRARKKSLVNVSSSRTSRLGTADLGQSVLSAATVLDVPIGGSESSDNNDEEGKQTIPGATFNLVKACLGSGVLSLPAGVAAIGDVPGALVPASILLTGVGVLSAYAFYSIGRLCELEDATSIGETWEKVMGKNTAWVVEIACLVTALGAALSYSIILGDFFCSLARSAGLKGIAATRHASILVVTLLALYPLCSLKSLAALSPVSVVGVFSVLLTCIFMGFRAVDGSYEAAGSFFSTVDIRHQRSFGKRGMTVISPAMLVLCSMSATAYMVHFIAPDFYHDLKQKNMKRYKKLTVLGFGITAAASVLMMCLGFLTFGGNSAGMILNNYSNVDAGASICRLLMAISLIGSYPFTFSAMRTNFIKLRYHGKIVTDALSQSVTRFLLAGTTILALLLEDVGFVVSFNGALMGSAIIYIVPSIIYLRTMRRRLEAGTIIESTKLKLERILNKFMIALGGLFAIMGGYISVVNSFFPHLLTY